MKFKVTQADIDAGIPDKPSLCPVALCIDRTLPGHEPSVSGEQICLEQWMGDPHWVMMLDTPELVRRFVQAFDARWPVEPFEFELSI